MASTDSTVMPSAVAESKHALDQAATSIPSADTDAKQAADQNVEGNWQSSCSSSYIIERWHDRDGTHTIVQKFSRLNCRPARIWVKMAM